MKPLIPVIGFCCLVSAAAAQDRALPGYIVKNSGDTVRGLLKEEGTDETARQISFSDPVSGSGYHVYTPDEVRSYQYADGNLFRIIRFTDPRNKDQVVVKTCYGKVLVTGQYDLYAFSDNAALYFVVKKDSNSYLLYDADPQAMPAASGNFRNELIFFANGSDAMRKEVEQTGYSISSMMAFFQRLDAYLDPGGSVRSYYHEARVQSGFMAYMGAMGYASRSQFTLELRWRRIWPQLNPQFSLNVGFRFASTVKLVADTNTASKVYRRINYQMTGFPVTAQYNLLKGNFHPYVCVGFSLLWASVGPNPHVAGYDYQGENMTFEGLMGLGFEAKVTRCLWARLDWRWEYVTQVPSIGIAVILP